MTQSPSSCQPTELFSVYLRPLASRLDATEVITLAVAIVESPATLADARLAGALFDALFHVPGSRLLLHWPDGSLGFAHIVVGQSVACVIAEAYDSARVVLEGFHLQHAVPFGAAH